MNGKQLKNSILQWAIQGKLVPQDPNDEPASVLLERIRAEKARLVKEGRIKKDKNESIIFRGEDNSHYEKFPDGRVVCIDDEIPFEIPQSWEWARMKDVLTFVNGRAYKKEELLNSGKYKVLRVGNFFTNESWYYSDFDLPEDKYCYNGDLLYAWSASFGPKIWHGEKTIFHYHIWNVKFPPDFLFREYLYYYLEYDKVQIRKSTTGSTMIHVSMENMNPRLLPIPPYNEQIRIVQQVEKILPIVQKYDLLNSSFEVLNSEIKDRLKKSILREAIQGRLVPQDQTDEPASELLNQILEEKRKLLIEGKLKKKDFVDSVIFKGEDNKYYEKVGGKTLEISEEIPFDLPESWSWCRLASIVHYRIGKTPARGETAYWEPGTIPWVSISDMKEYGTVVHTKEYVSPKATTLLGKISPRGTLLMSFKLTVGRTAVLGIDAYHNEAIISIWPLFDSTSLQPYLFYTLPVLANLGDSKDAIKGRTLNTSSINNLLIPLPPSAEQIRIVNRIKKLYRHL